ncbi:MAG: hypothetical protein K2K23_08075 [Muribaculaceae bacterium]|nr:hypothetical protein [Muribaculaceae bacterium]
MKKLNYSFLAIVALLLVVVSCSKSESGNDAESLLRTVPADASSVALCNVAYIVDRLGGSTDGSTIKLSKEHTKAIKESQALKEKDKKHIMDVLEGQTGMALNSFVYFSAARTYITGLLNDPDKFIAYEQEQNPSYQWRDEDGGKVLGSLAVVGNQFWICTTGTPDVEQLKYYQQLNDKQSYVSSDAVSLLSDTEKAITFVADVKKSIAFLPNSTYLRIGSSLIFDDMSYVAGYVDIEKKNIMASAAVLNSDMKPAELLLPTEKIDASIVKSLGESGDVVAAMGISQKLVKKISDAAGTALGQGSDALAGMLQAIDGTVAVRANSSMDNVEAKVQTNGKDFADLANMINSFLGLTVSRDGNILTAVRGNKDFNGPITSQKAAEKLKGAWIGVVSDGMLVRDVVSVTRLVPEKKSLRLDIEAEGGVDAFLNAVLK